MVGSSVADGAKLARWREPSTWAGVAVLVGLVLPDDVAQALGAVGPALVDAAAGVAALAAVILRERGR